VAWNPESFTEEQRRVASKAIVRAQVLLDISSLASARRQCARSVEVPKSPIRGIYETSECRSGVPVESPQVCFVVSIRDDLP
jgi:hypothetical protein